MNIFETYQEDIFSCFQLPTLSKHMSIELLPLEPVQFQRAYSDFSINYCNLFIQSDWEIFPQIDFSQIFNDEEIFKPALIPVQAEESVNNVNQAGINLAEVQKVVDENIDQAHVDEEREFLIGFNLDAEEMYQNEGNEEIVNPEEREFLFGFNFGVEENEVVANNAEENEFLFGFDVVDDNEVRNPRAPRAPRAPRPPREQRQQQRAPARRNNFIQEEPVDYIIEELFLNADIKFPHEIAEELKQQMMEFAFYELQEFDPTFIQCKICLAITSDYYDLDCKHRYCVPCFTMFCESLLDSCKILPEELQCPDCNQVFSDNHFFRYLAFDKITKISDLRFKIKGQKLVAEKKAVNCPVPDCPGYAHILKDEKITACCKCKCTLCCFCGLGVHPGMTCEENSQISQDETLEKLLLSQNWKRCPTCGVPVEKMDGCQFLYCDSLICKGKNNLCYLCGRFVIEAQHFSHYKTKGPFGDTCNTLDGIPEDIDPNLVVPGANIEGVGGEEE